MKLSNTIYDILKWVTIYLLPAIGTLYFSISTIWGLPYSEQVMGTISAIETFLAIILGISTFNYNRKE